jgi:hypothetical protein
MHPTKTLYRLAHSPQDYQRCHQLLKDQGIESDRLSWPTIVALRENELIGCLGTIPSDKAIIAGPIVATSRHPFVTLLRLCEAYERVLWQAGVRSYCFGVEHSQTVWRGILDKLNFEPFYQDEDAAWYRRTLEG